MSTSPFRRILIPIDFTQDADATVHSGFEVEIAGGNTVGVAPASSKALELAAGIIDDEGELCLVHATPTYENARLYGSAGMGVVGAGDIHEVHAAARAASLKVLEALAEHYASGINISFVVRPGIALQVILEEAERFDAQLLVIAASGRNRVARFFLGSTADRVIRQSPCPVMVVPPKQDA